MALGTHFTAFEAAVRANGLVLASTPCKVCTAQGARLQSNISLTRANGQPNEQYYKWMLVHGVVAAGLVPAANVGCELSVPRGSRGSSSLFVDVAIFKDASWAQLYDDILANVPGADWDDLTALLVGCGEIKDDVMDDMEATIRRQLIPAMNAIAEPYGLGFYFNSGHLVLAARISDATGTSVTRLDPAKQGDTGSATARLQPAVPDQWDLFPSLDIILKRGAGQAGTTRSGRVPADLDVMSSRSQRPVENALDKINRVLDSTSLRAETGYKIVIETLAAKVYDEKFHGTRSGSLDFYIDASESPGSGSAITGGFATFRDRLRALHDDARPKYFSILGQSVIQWDNATHMKIVAEVVRGFQDMSFSLSSKSDLYQVVFYNFAGPLSKVANAQFMTPIRVIEFMVEIAAPRPGQSICDPTMGIADFLAVSYTRGRDTGQDLNDSDLFGVDNDSNMLMLAGLNMLLNGDGGARLFHVPDTGSLDHKPAVNAATGDVEASFRLDPTSNANGHWEQPRGSGHMLFHFDLILTNPPFGDGRALKLDDPTHAAVNRQIASMHEIYAASGSGRQIDKGLLFLENAVRLVKPQHGRFGIILSNAIASVGEYRRAREWLLDNCRLVAAFDLPKDTFAETGVPTTILFGYTCSAAELNALKRLPYQVYMKEITKVGFTKVTRQRVTYLLDKYLLDPATGLVLHDSQTGQPLLDEEFSETIVDFRQWARTQEAALQALFLP